MFDNNILIFKKCIFCTYLVSLIKLPWSGGESTEFPFWYSRRQIADNKNELRSQIVKKKI